jgi:hypothetical protein
MLANIKLEAFNQPPLNKKDIAQILPTLKYPILSEMIAEQVDIEERDLKKLLSNPRFKDSLSDVNPYTHSLQEDSVIGGTAKERHPDTSSLSEIPILSTPSLKRVNVAQDPPQRVSRSKKREAAGIPFGVELDPKRTRLDV